MSDRDWAEERARELLRDWIIAAKQALEHILAAELRSAHASGLREGMQRAREAGRRRLYEESGYYPHARQSGDDVLAAIDSLIASLDDPKRGGADDGR